MKRIQLIVSGVAILCMAVVAVSAEQGTARLATAVRPAKSFVWTIERNGQPAGWLMGSIHMLTPDAYPLPPAMESAFQASQVLIEETDP